MEDLITKHIFKVIFMRQILFFAFSFMLIANSSCKKQKPETVAIRGVTFGCQVNGKNFIPDYWDYGYNIPPVSLKFIAGSNNALDLLLDANKQDEYIQIYLNHPLTKGKHELNFNTLPFPISDPPKDNGVYVINNSAQFITNTDVGGYVNLIEIDTITHKVYGTFEFTGTDANTMKQVKVTNGVFKNY